MIFGGDYFFVALLLCTVYIVYYVLTATRSRTWSLPGPLAARLSKFYRVYMLWTGRGPVNYYELHQKYGPVVATGPNHVSLSDPVAISLIYDFRNTYLKSHFYNVFKPLYHGKPMDTIFTVSNAVDMKISKRCLVTYMTGCPRDYAPPIQRSVDLFVNDMKDSAGQSIDFFTWSFFWAFDMTFDIMFGDDLGFMKTRSDVNNLVKFTCQIFRPAVLLGMVPEYVPLLLGSQRFMSTMRKFSKSFPDPTQDLFDTLEERVRRHDQTPHDCGGAFVCRVLKHENKEQEHIPYEDVVSMLFEAFYAAATESAVTIRSIFYILLKHRHIYDILIKELRQDLPVDELIKNKYLQAVIKETLRLQTSNSPPMERFVPKEGLEINGHSIPAGTVVSVAHFATHRDPDVYGPDFLECRPERWLDTDANTDNDPDQTSRLRKMEHNFLAFGKGNRACPGRELGVLELSMFLVHVLRRFDIEWANPGQKTYIKAYWVIEQFGMDVKFTEVSLPATN